MTLSFTHIAWIAVLLLSSFAAGWMLRRLRSLEREADLDEALRQAEEKAGGVDAERQQHLTLLKRNLDTEAAAKAALEASVKKKSNELAQARAALNDARAEIKTLRDAAAIANPVDPNDTAAVTEAAISTRLTAALAERDRKLVQLEVEIGRIQASKADVERRVDEARAQLAEVQRIVAERERTIAAQNEEMDKWRARVPKLAESLKVREATIVERQQTIDALTERAAKLEQEGGALQQQNAALRQEIVALEQQDEGARGRLAELSLKLDDMSRQLAAARREQKVDADGYEKRLQAQTRDLEAFMREVDTLRRERYELVRAADAQRVELTARAHEEQRLTERIEELGTELTRLQFEQRSWANQRDAHATTIATLEADRGGLVLEIERLTQRAEEAAELAVSRDIQLKREFGTRARLERELTELRYRAAPLEELLERRDAELAERGARIEALQAQVAKLDSTLAQHQARTSELEREAAARGDAGPDPRADYLEKRLVQQIEKNHELTRALSDRDKQIVAVARDKSLHEKSLAVLTQQLKDAREENERLAARLGPETVAAVAQRAQAPDPPDDDDWQRPIDADDLQAIRGIGRSFERKLNELGITRLSQIVNLGDDDIDLIERELDMYKGRIGRDDWVGQAAALIADSGELDRPLPPSPPPALQGIANGSR